MVRFKHKGDFKITQKFFDKITGGRYLDAVLSKYGQKGIDALASATPTDSGLTASSWGFEVQRFSDGNARIIWTNSNVQKGWFNVAINLQYGHGTRNGGWVEGRDYINPAIRPIFDQIAEDAWREVTKN